MQREMALQLDLMDDGWRNLTKVYEEVNSGTQNRESRMAALDSWT